MESVSESLMSWVERESDKYQGKGDDQLALQIIVDKLHDAGVWSDSDYAWLCRRIKSNQ